jgi:hypothetical protein
MAPIHQRGQNGEEDFEEGQEDGSDEVPEASDAPLISYELQPLVSEWSWPRGPEELGILSAAASTGSSSLCFWGDKLRVAYASRY